MQTARSDSRVTRTTISRASPEYFTALSSRLCRTCPIASASISSGGSAGSGVSSSIRNPASRVRTRNVSTVALTTSSRLVRENSYTFAPDSIREKSRMLSMRRDSLRPSASMCSPYFRTFSGDSA